MKELVVYVPGLGGENILQYQRQITYDWKSEKRDVLFLETNWRGGEAYQQKIKRLVADVELHIGNEHERLVLVGSSAGGSMAVNLFNELKVHYENIKCVSISGKLKRPQLIGQAYRRPHPALVDSVVATEKVVAELSQTDKQKMLTMGPLFDEVIALKDMRISGVKHRRIPTLGHVIGIGFALKHMTKAILR